MAETQYLTPTELIKKYPQVKVNFNWSVREIGQLFRMKMLLGYYDSKHQTYINEASFIRAIQFTNETIDGQKCDI